VERALRRTLSPDVRQPLKACGFPVVKGIAGRSVRATISLVFLPEQFCWAQAEAFEHPRGDLFPRISLLQEEDVMRFVAVFLRDGTAETFDLPVVAIDNPV
jgi:hypothetical protein